MKQAIEILAPAGNKEALRAAVSNGANAVYLAGNYFGARAFAGNFTKEELIGAIQYAHERNVKVFITTNTIVMDAEVEKFLHYVGFLYENDADAIIIQDIGMAHLVRELYPDLPLHASTQMTSVNSSDSLYLKKLGFERVVYARENSLQELEEIKLKTQMESEAFVHGALCICYSGNCLFSAMTTERSGNRGSCSQPCRMKYHLLKNNKISEEGYLLSAKDLSSIRRIETLLDSSIDSWKIEGRMKRSEYVATVVNHYRTLKEGTAPYSQREKSEMENEIRHIFQREYTDGYLLSAEKESVVNPQSPKNKGVLSAKVLYCDKKRKRIGLFLLDDIEVGDGLSTGEKVGRILKGSRIVSSAKKGEKIELDYVGSISQGEEIYKTYAKKIMEKAICSFEQERFSFPLTMSLNLEVGKKAKLILKDEEGREVDYEDEKELEEAKSVSLDFDLAYRQMSKLGDTPYVLAQEDFSLNQVGNVFISKSDLNRIRRNAVSMLAQKRQKRYQRREIDKEFIKQTIEERRYSSDFGKGAAAFYVRCRTKEQLDACRCEGIDAVYVDTRELWEYATALFDKSKVYYVLPDVVTERDLKYVHEIVTHLGDHFVTNSLGLLYEYRDKNIVGDYLLNLANRYSLDRLQAKRLTPSLEWIYSKYFEDLDSVLNKERVEIPVYLTPMLMIMEYPLASKHLSKKEDTLFLVDMEGNRLPVMKDDLGKTKLFSYEKKELHSDIKTLYLMGYRNFRLEFLSEDRSGTEKVIQDYRNYLKEVER